MLYQQPLISAAVVLTISVIPSASSFSAPPSNHQHYSCRQYLDAIHPRQHHDSYTSVARRQRCAGGCIISQHASSLGSTASPETEDNTSSSLSASERIENCKRELIQQCNAHESSSGKKSSTIENKILELEQLGAELGIGLESSLSGLLSGEW